MVSEKKIRTALSPLTNILNTFFDLVFPNICYLCDTNINNSKFPVCKKCIDSIPKITPVKLDSYIERNFSTNKNIDHFYSKFRFEEKGKYQDLVHLVKYKRIKKVGVQIGVELSKDLINIPWFNELDLLIPVPIHRLKKIQRGGYNQSTEICKGIKLKTNKDYSEKAVIRKTYTETQTKLSIEERRKNVASVFSVKLPHLILNKNIALIDDVCTTGATLKECIKTIAEHHPKSISIITGAVVTS